MINVESVNEQVKHTFICCEVSCTFLSLQYSCRLSLKKIIAREEETPLTASPVMIDNVSNLVDYSESQMGKANEKVLLFIEEHSSCSYAI